VGRGGADCQPADAALDLDQVLDRAPSDKIAAHMTSTVNDALLTRGTAVLRAEHEWVSRVLAVAERMAERALLGPAVAAGDCDALLALLRQFVDYLHHTKEEQHLFPLLERKGLPRAGGPIGVMLAEHERSRALIAEIARLGASPDSARPWSDAVRTCATLMRQHVHKENSVLYVMAERLLSADEQEQIARACAQLDAQPPGPDIRARLGADLPRLEQAYPAHP
jgi:hemerythrin-like domain-containing protein